MRGNAQDVENQERRVGERGAPPALPEMLACRRTDGRSQDGQSARVPSQTAGKLHVFHERHLGKAAQGLENRSPHENRLIPENRSEKTAAPRFPGLQPAQTRMPLVETAAERPTPDVWVTHGFSQTLEMFAGQLRVGVMKEQDFARGQAARLVHLEPTSRSAAPHDPQARESRRSGSRLAAGGGDQHLFDQSIAQPPRRRFVRHRVLAPARHDDADTRADSHRFNLGGRQEKASFDRWRSDPFHSCRSDAG